MANAEQSTAPEQPRKITFRFCRECSNMLYPREDRLSNTLMFACRTCQFSEPANTSCIYRNELSNTVGETAGITQDVGSDPTVGDDDSSPLPFCTMCGQEIVCSFCGEPEPDIGYFLEVDDYDENSAQDGDVTNGGQEHEENTKGSL